MNFYMTGCRREWQRRGISPQELMVNNQMRLLWEQHVYWTRMFISGTVFHSPDVKLTEKRLLQNPGDFAVVFRPIYGEETAAQFQTLFTEHLTIAGELVTAASQGQNAAAAEAERRWYENADQIAVFLAGINPCFTVREWQDMMYRHLYMTKKEAVAFIGARFEESIVVFGEIEQEALEMADMMTQGVISL